MHQTKEDVSFSLTAIPPVTDTVKNKTDTKRAADNGVSDNKPKTYVTIIVHKVVIALPNLLAGYIKFRQT